MQNIILYELALTDFFSFATFYGGTSLRIFRGLDRFSEDLDFTLIKSTDKNLLEYLIKVQKNFGSYGIEPHIKSKNKAVYTTVESHDLQFNLKNLLEITYPEYSEKVNPDELITIKVELEHKFFNGGITETLFLNCPSFVQIKSFTIETLFAYKLLAILNRNWGHRVKGRDYFDYLFYVQKDTSINMEFLRNGLISSDYIKEGDAYSLNNLKNDLNKRFNEIDYGDVIKDVSSFVKNPNNLQFSMKKEIFIHTVNLLKESIK